MKAESGLRGRIRLALRQEFGRFHAKIVGQPANAMTGPGRSDLYVLVLGVHVDLEIKTATGQPTEIQLDNVQTTRAAGGYAWIVRTPQAAVGAVWTAIKASRGEPMSGEINFDDLFSETGGPAFKPSEVEIRAFLEGPVDPPSSEPEIQAAVERNGQMPSGDGSAIEPSDDYTLASELAQLRALMFEVSEGLVRINKKADHLTRLLESTLRGESPAEEGMATSAEVAALLQGPDEPPTTSPARPTTRRARKPSAS